MSEHTPPSRADDESTKASEQSTRTEYVERSDVGVSLTVKLTRGTGTRDQDKIVAKRKARLWKTLARTWRFFGSTSMISQRTLVRSNPRKKTGNGEGCFCRLSSGGGDHQ